MRLTRKVRQYGSFPGFLFLGAFRSPMPKLYGELVPERPMKFFLPLSFLCFSTFSVAQNTAPTEGSKLERQFQSAASAYQAGHLAEAAAQIESLLPHVPKSFEAHELLGLVYASESQDAKAEVQLQAAVRLKPESAAARTNLATCLTHAGKLAPAAEQFRKALQIEPNDYAANHNLAEIYVEGGKLADAVPRFEKAQQIDPTAYDNSYNLAEAYFLTGDLPAAQKQVEKTLQAKNTGELHNLLGQIDEKQAKYLHAASEFETAAHLDPSEDNLFTWGSELLLHRTYEPAIDVFQQATLRYPSSARLFIGLGMALYSRGKYDDAIKSLLAAADLNPKDARCYLFLSKAYLSSPNQASDVIERFHRYAELQPTNALAQYYYAMSLWKGKRLEEASVDLHPVESLLQKSIALDGTIADAHLQLGIFYAEQHQYDKSLPEYQRALALNANLPDAHYRLGQYYVHAGQKEQAQQEFDLYQKQQAEHQAAVDKERAEVQQFVYAAKAAPPSKQ